MTDDSDPQPITEPEVPHKSEAQIRCEKLLRNAGIEAGPFLERLSSLKTSVSAEQFIANADKGLVKPSEKRPSVENDVQAAMTLRAIFLESKDPLKTHNTIRRLATVTDKEMGTGKKIGAGIMLFVDGRKLTHHYLDVGIRRSLWEARQLIKAEVQTEGRFFPKVSFKKRNKEEISERVFAIAEKQLDRLLDKKTGKEAISHIGEFVSMDSASLRSVVQAAKNVMKDPKTKALILAKFEGNSSSIELDEETVATMLRETLSVTANLHKNEYNIQRISQFISVISKKREGEENKAEFLAEYWEKEAVARARANGEKSTETVQPKLLESKEPEKIAFANQPAVNLGAAVVSVGLAKWVSSMLGKKTTDKDGKEHPPSGWKKAAKWLTITALTVVTGMALWRAGTLARSDGTSWIERAFDPNLVSGRSR